MLTDTDHKVQEQAFWVIRNIAEDESCIDMVFRELGEHDLFNSLVVGLESPHEEVVLQVRIVVST
jgi:hypothetical protein